MHQAAPYKVFSHFLNLFCQRLKGLFLFDSNKTNTFLYGNKKMLQDLGSSIRHCWNIQYNSGHKNPMKIICFCIIHSYTNLKLLLSFLVLMLGQLLIKVLFKVTFTSISMISQMFLP